MRFRWASGSSGVWAASAEPIIDLDDRRDRIEARTDSLTGLANRRQILSVLDRQLMFSAPGSVAVLFIDLDHFKSVNDTFGHAAGDRVLRIIGHRLQSFGPQLDIIARIGGDEFAACVSHIESQAAVRELAERLQDAMSEPIVLAGQRLKVASSIGMTFSDGRSDAAALLSQADQAMYDAKHRARGTITSFHRDPSDTASWALPSGGPDRAAGIEVWFQPIVTRDGKLMAAEALARWRQGSTVVSADAFIPLAERSGDITLITGKVLRKALEALNAMPAQVGGAAPRMHVNVSQAHLGDGRLLKLIGIACRSLGITAERLCLEITESALTNDLGFAATQLHRLREMGCTVAMDDFGTGYASMTLLKNLPIDVIKIDRSFITGMGEDATRRAIVESVVTLARGIGATVIGEGVEDAADVRSALDGCDGLQGYHFGRPLPLDGFLDRTRSGAFRMDGPSR